MNACLRLLLICEPAPHFSAATARAWTLADSAHASLHMVVLSNLLSGLRVLDNAMQQRLFGMPAGVVGLPNRSDAELHLLPAYDDLSGNFLVYATGPVARTPGIAVQMSGNFRQHMDVVEMGTLYRTGLAKIIGSSKEHVLYWVNSSILAIRR